MTAISDDQLCALVRNHIVEVNRRIDDDRSEVAAKTAALSAASQEHLCGHSANQIFRKSLFFSPEQRPPGSPSKEAPTTLSSHDLELLVAKLGEFEQRLSRCEDENRTLRLEVVALKANSAAPPNAEAGEEALCMVGVRLTDPPPKETICDNCFHKGVCTPCPRCESEWYCSVNCALLRRLKHSEACAMLQERKYAKRQENKTI